MKTSVYPNHPSVPLLIPAAPTKLAKPGNPSKAGSITAAVSTAPAASSCLRRFRHRCAGLSVPLLLGLGGLHLSICSWSSAAEDIYNLPTGVSGRVLPAGSNWTLPLKQEPLMKFISQPDDATQEELYWQDEDWGNAYYFPIPVGTSTRGIDVPSSPYNGSHIEVHGDLKQDHHHLLAARVDNLQFLGGYYPYDFESRIKLYGVNRDMTESYKYGFLDLVSGNPHLGTTNRISPDNLVDKWIEKALDAHNKRPLTVSDNGHATSKLAGFAGGTNGPGGMAFDGVMHSFYDSGSTEAPVLVVDLGSELPVDRIVLRWHGEGSEDQDYALYAFDHSHKHKSIKDVYKLFGKGQADGYCIYRGTTNAYVTDLMGDVRNTGAPSDERDNNTIVQTNWKKTNSYYSMRPGTELVTDDVVELFQRKDGSELRSVQFIAFQGFPTKGKPFQIAELEVYGYPVKRHQAEDPRLFETAAKTYLLYNSTLDGKIYDRLADGGQGRYQFLAEIKKNSEGKLHADSANILKLHFAGEQTFFDGGRYFVEKNLVPFVPLNATAAADRLNMIYGFDPLMVYAVDLTSGAMTEISKADSNVHQMWGNGKLGPVRGGTPALYDDKGGGGFIALFHSSNREVFYGDIGTQKNVKQYKYTYYTGLLRFDTDGGSNTYRITHVSPEPLLVSTWYEEYNPEHKKVAFACGLDHHPDYNKNDSDHYGCFYATSGIADQRVDVTLITRDLIDAMVEVSPEKDEVSKPLDIYVAIGLSNTAGRAAIEAMDQWAIDRAFLFNEEGEWISPQEPMNNYSNVRKADNRGPRQKLGPTGSFVRALLDAPGHDQLQIGLVVNCRGGTSLRAWLPKDDPLYYNSHETEERDGKVIDIDRYSMSVQRIHQAIEAGNGNTLKGVFILAGEGDLDDYLIDTYNTVVSNLVNYLREEFENPHLPFVTSAILEETGYVPDPKKFTEKQYPEVLRYLPQKPKLNQEIMKLPGVVDELAVVNLNPALYSIGDGTHYNSSSTRTLGAAMAKEMDALVYGANDQKNAFYDARVSTLKAAIHP